MIGVKILLSKALVIALIVAIGGGEGFRFKAGQGADIPKIELEGIEVPS